MNAKFEDIASSKNSAKLEFNKLVQNLTKPRNCGHKDCESESNEDNEWMHTSENQQTDSDCDDWSDNSSFDEQTLHLNHEKLKQYFKNKAKQEEVVKKTQIANNAQMFVRNVDTGKKGSKKELPDKACFSNSRYDHVAEDIEEDILQFYDDQTRNSYNSNKYAVPESKIDLHELSAQGSYEQHARDELYVQAKNSLNRTKNLLLASQQDSEEINNEVEMLNLNSKRVKSILRNKEKRKTAKTKNQSELFQKFKSDGSMEEDSESWKIHISTEIDADGQLEESKTMNQRNESRNHLNSRLGAAKSTYDPQRYIHQTTSSGNLVLYDSVMRMSSQSPQEMLDAHLIERLQGNFEIQSYNEYSDEDILQNKPYVAGTYFLISIFKFNRVHDNSNTTLLILSCRWTLLRTNGKKQLFQFSNS